jgi:putative ABC transport system ATP-binding protein
MDLFVRLNEEKKSTIVLVTHEPDISTFSKRIIRFLDGKIVSDEENKR